jgi:hypothetical protein
MLLFTHARKFFRVRVNRIVKEQLALVGRDGWRYGRRK